METMAGVFLAFFVVLVIGFLAKASWDFDVAHKEGEERKEFNRTQCAGCDQYGDNLERFVVAEDALGPLVTLYYHPECKKKMVLAYLACGHSPYMGTFSPFTEHREQVIPEDVQEMAKEEFDRLIERD